MIQMKKFKKGIIILSLPFILLMCMTIENIVHPDDPQVNSEIEIGVDIKLIAETDDNTELVFAILAPKSWHIADNAELTFSTNGYSKGDVVNERMILMPSTEKEPSTLLDWSTAFQSEVGLMDNYGPVEWVVFQSQTRFNILDNDEITANIKIKLETGSENIKLYMGYAFCGKQHGFDGGYYKKNAKSKVLTVTGGTNPLIDYTTVSLVSTIPVNFSWGDIFSINFNTVSEGIETPLKDADKVYMYGKAIFVKGESFSKDSSIIDIISEKTLMEKISKNTWQKYIYPKDFFELPDDAVITEVYVHFTNEDKSIIVGEPSGNDFSITENCP